MGTMYFPQQHIAANISKKLMELRLDFGVYPRAHDGIPPQSVQAMRRKMEFYFREEPELDKPVLTNDCGSRDGHGIPKCCPCPSVVFLISLGPSVRFRVFFWVVSSAVPDATTTLLRLQSSDCHTLGDTGLDSKYAQTTCRVPHKASNAQWNVYSSQASKDARSQRTSKHTNSANQQVPKRRVFTTEFAKWYNDYIPITATH